MTSYINGIGVNHIIPGPAYDLSTEMGRQDAEFIMSIQQVIAETHATARAAWKAELEKYKTMGPSLRSK